MQFCILLTGSCSFYKAYLKLSWKLHCICFSQDESKQNAEGSEGCSEMDDDDKVIAERSWAAFMIAAELLVASLSSCSSEISGDCISGYSL